MFDTLLRFLRRRLPTEVIKEVDLPSTVLKFEERWVPAQKSNVTVRIVQRHSPFFATILIFLLSGRKLRYLRNLIYLCGCDP